MKALFKNLLNPKNLPWTCLWAGALGYFLVLIISLTGISGKSLTPTGSVLYGLLWVIIAAVGGLFVYLTRDLQQGAKFRFNFPASNAGAIGAAAAAAGILITCFGKIGPADALAAADLILGLLSVGALGFIAYCRSKGLHPSVLFYTVICLYLMVDLICLYRLRSADPLVWKYCFSLLASVSVMLAAYQNAAFAANAGSRRMHTLSHLAAACLCLVCLPWSETPLFYLGMAAWMMTNYCNLTPMPRTRR